LSEFGMSRDDIATIVMESGGNSMKSNPLILTDQELQQILNKRF